MTHSLSSGGPVSPDIYRQIFDMVDTGFCIVEMIFDGDRAVDYRFVAVNRMFEQQTGLVDPVGRTARELVPGLEQHWYDTYGRVALTGEPARFGNGSEAMGRWFEVQALRVGDPAERRIGILFADVSDQRRSEHAARESEERLQQALSAGHGIGTWDWDVTTDLVRADERFARLYGVDPDRAAHGAPIAAFFGRMHSDDRLPAEARIEQAISSGGEFIAEYRLIQDDGSTRWVAAQGRCRLDDQGRPVRFPGVSFDITDQKRAAMRQSTLLELGDRLRDLTDIGEISYVSSEILGRALGVSRAGYGVIDTGAETITIDRDWNAPGVTSIAGVLQFREYGSYIEDLKAGRTVQIADVARDPRTRATADALRGIAAASFVNMPLLEQGRIVALVFVNNAEPRPYDDDELALIREVASRVRAATERVRADEARRQSEEQFRVFAQAVPNQIWAAHADGHLYWFNDQVYAYSGLDKAGLAGLMAWTDIVHPDDAAEAGRRWVHAIMTGEVYGVEFRIRRADGAYRWFLVRAEPVRAGGVIVRWVGTNTDIDDQRRFADTLEEQVAARTRELMVAEEALRQSQKMEAVGQLTGGIAHDFNNLLTGIIGSLELLGIRIAQGRLADVERYSLAAQGAAKRAASLTHRLLAFSRRQTLDPKPTDMNRLIAGMEDLIRRTIGPGIELETVAAGGLWSTLVDPNQLENALLNLCINARDAMPDGGRLTIESANRWLDARAARDRDLEPGQYVSLCVSDTGTGMTPEVIAKAFDPFFTTKPLGVGTGLGLSMIYGFTRQSGGQVRIYSEPGEGTMVCLYLPRHRGEADGVEAMPDLADAPRTSEGETVLVVDDEPTVRMLVVEVLEELGYLPIEAADGAAGLKILQSAIPIDLLVTDVGLPGGMNGRQMADAARLVRPGLKTLFITGYAENAVVGNGHLDAGMHVMTKPFAMEALATRIRELIQVK
ncbi:PAS domain-containing protein [Sphingomonas sp. CFBP 8760]|uniref:PAS domain-containing protein n=1 Tax=Sphingomonas sp. CFBP 8760 TaxID=2775282 RepID=UPI001780AF50|nr:PAS domain-containing protein [Sphingomonas sp. CFBP 8760]MBD8545732.1 PAS domain-containing protein [Sphingomonas sp. CFBP 8760]